MHHVRGLVHRSSTAALCKLEKQIVPHDVATCFVGAAFVDAEGASSAVQLLHPAALLQLLTTLPKSEALLWVQKAREMVLSPSPGRKVTLDSTNHFPILCVKHTTSETVAELQRRQSHFLSKAEGRLMAHNLHLVEAFTQQESTGASYTDKVAVYRGMVEELAKIKPAVSLALAMNPNFSSLGSGASAALAELVNLDKTDAVLSFLEGFAEKDEMLPASETCATQVAIRLRNKLWGLQNANAEESARALLQGSLAMACRFNVDPGVVFPTDAAAIQRWSSQFLHSGMWPLERAEVISDIVRRKRLLPRRVSLDSLSSWCLNDLERLWLSGLLGDDQTGVVADAESLSKAVVYRAALACALKDLKRCLVDNRLLRQYALLLRDSHVEPGHPSFSHFIEECGECHGDNESPEELCFLIQAGTQTVMESLVALAPQCSYWRTLLARRQEDVEAVVVPHERHLRVRVKLPRGHECVEAAAARAVRTPSSNSPSLPDLPIIFEDRDMVVFNKPPHIATSRHALSCTQLNDPMVTDVISMVLASAERGDVMRGVFRQGQVHRLDTETSGCLVMAKTECAVASLRHQMGTSAAYSQSSKVYIALCVVLEPDLARIPLRGVLRDPKDPKIITKFRIVRFIQRFRIAIVECRIQQGKKHQIRRHLAAAGLPILQDVEHGGAACCSPLIQRVALHAAAITLVHPRSAEVVTFVAPLTRDLQEAIRKLTQTV